jgi:hypothetical protein
MATKKSPKATSTVGTKDTPESQLQALIEKFDPDGQRLIRALRSALRKRFPAANELAYDYGFSLVIAYSPTERGIEGIFSISARTEGVSLYFMNGPKLPDPKKLLMGSAKLVRFIPVESASRLKHPDVEALIAATLDIASVPMPSKGTGKLIIMTSAAKKKARRKPSK